MSAAARLSTANSRGSLARCVNWRFAILFQRKLRKRVPFLKLTHPVVDRFWDVTLRQLISDLLERSAPRTANEFEFTATDDATAVRHLEDELRAPAVRAGAVVSSRAANQTPITIFQECLRVPGQGSTIAARSCKTA